MKKIHVWITKYALSTGVFEADAEVCGIEDMIEVTTNGYSAYYHGNDWHANKEDAIKRFNDMRDRKIKSLKKQLLKIEDMKFEL